MKPNTEDHDLPPTGGGTMEPARCREIRLRGGLSQRSFAEALGVGRTLVQGWETGRRRIDPVWATDIEAFGRGEELPELDDARASRAAWARGEPQEPMTPVSGKALAAIGVAIVAFIGGLAWLARPAAWAAAVAPVQETPTNAHEGSAGATKTEQPSGEVPGDGSSALNVTRTRSGSRRS